MSPTASIVASAKPGVTVTIEDLEKGFPIVKAESVAQGLCEILSSYLRSYPNVHVHGPTGLIDPWP